MRKRVGLRFRELALLGPEGVMRRDSLNLLPTLLRIPVLLFNLCVFTNTE